MKFRYHKNSKNRFIGIIHYKVGLSFFTEKKIFDKVVIKTTPSDIELNYKKWFVFTFVRLPFNRLISFYNDKCVKNVDNKIKNNINKIQKCQKIILRHFKLPLKINNLKQITFSYLFININKFIYRDNHFLPYEVGCINNNKIIADFVGKLENFDNDIQKIIKTDNIIKINKTINVNIFDYYNLETIFVVGNAYDKDFYYFYPKIYKQLTDFIINYDFKINYDFTINYKNKINTTIIKTEIGKKLLNNKKNILKIENSFLQLFIKFNDDIYEKFKNDLY